MCLLCLASFGVSVQSSSTLERVHLDYFHFLANLDEAAVNIYAHASMWTYVSFLLRIYHLLGHKVTLWFTFDKLPDCFPKRLHRFTCPSAVCEGSSFSRSSVISLTIAILAGMWWHERFLSSRVHLRA